MTNLLISLTPFLALKGSLFKKKLTEICSLFLVAPIIAKKTIQGNTTPVKGVTKIKEKLNTDLLKTSAATSNVKTTNSILEIPVIVLKIPSIIDRDVDVISAPLLNENPPLAK
jgi:hypothetical protein